MFSCTQSASREQSTDEVLKMIPVLVKHISAAPNPVKSNSLIEFMLAYALWQAASELLIEGLAERLESLVVELNR